MRINAETPSNGKKMEVRFRDKSMMGGQKKNILVGEFVLLTLCPVQYSNESELKREA